MKVPVKLQDLVMTIPLKLIKLPVKTNLLKLMKSPIIKKTNDMEFKPVKKSRKKEKFQSRIDFNFYICEKTKESASTNAKLALNHMEKFLGRSFSTSPSFLGQTAGKHFVFLTKVKEEKGEQLFNYIKGGSLNSRNLKNLL